MSVVKSQPNVSSEFSFNEKVLEQLEASVVQLQLLYVIRIHYYHYYFVNLISLCIKSKRIITISNNSATRFY